MDGIPDFPVSDDLEVASADEILRQIQRIPDASFITYSIYSRKNGSLLGSIKQLREFIQSLISGYLWHREPFNLHFVQVDNASRENIDEFVLLQGVTFHGGCVDDEWFIVYILEKLSQHYPDVAIRAVDEDGEFLLIEAAEVLPDWITPDNVDGRVWLRNGEICLIADNAVQHVCEYANTMLSEQYLKYRSDTVTIAINKRITMALHSKDANRHDSRVIIPQSVAAILAANPNVLGIAIQSLLSADNLERKSLATMKRFSLAPYVTSIVSFPRMSYAELAFLTFNPPPHLKSIKRKFNFLDSKTAAALDLGFRLTCGLELAASSSERFFKLNSVDSLPVGVFPRVGITDFNISTTVVSLDSMTSEGRQEYIEDQEIRHLYAIHHALNNTKLDKDFNQIDINNIVTKDTIVEQINDDNWLYLSAPDIETKLNVYGIASVKNKMEESGLSDLDSIVEKVGSFVVNKSDVEGIQNNSFELSSESSEESEEEESSIFNDDEDGEIIIDGDKLHNILHQYAYRSENCSAALSETALNVIDVNSGMQKDDNGTIIDPISNHNSIGGIGMYTLSEQECSDGQQSDRCDSDDDGVVNEILSSTCTHYEEMLDEELVNTTMSESFVRMKDSNDVDLDKNLLSYVLESHASQLGRAGPVSNLLSTIGASLPFAYQESKGQNK